MDELFYAGFPEGGGPPENGEITQSTPKELEIKIKQKKTC